MSPPRSIPAETASRQLAASDPGVSAWVSANAGSGKTTVLTRRVIRLLLDGAAPSAILCLTFTKAAAANMQNRVFKTLGMWAGLGDDELRAEIEALSGRRPDDAGLVRARRLFAAALETPGGLKVLTIHAFCERVLHLFPFEANVPAQFRVLEERSAADLLETARRGLIVDANARPSSRIGRAMARVVEEAASQKVFDDLIAEVVAKRDEIKAILRDGDASIVAERLRRALGVREGESAAAIDAEIAREAWGRKSGPGLPPSSRRQAMCRWSSSASSSEPRTRRRGSSDGGPTSGFSSARRSQKRHARSLTKSVRLAAPILAERLVAELERVSALVERRKLAAAAERTEALLDLPRSCSPLCGGEAGAGRPRFRRPGRRTVSLLLRAGAEWVLYKLDRGIDHILVDEAQDTSPSNGRSSASWPMSSPPATAPRGARRTLFAVGDEKQSIFSFQGAAPAEFARMRRPFRPGLPRGRPRVRADRPDPLLPLDAGCPGGGRCGLRRCRQSRAGLSSDDVATLHATIRGDAPGSVEVWPVISRRRRPPDRGLGRALRRGAARQPRCRSASASPPPSRASSAEGDPATGARYSAGDVMVLVRSRNALFEAVIRALKREACRSPAPTASC